MYGLRNALPTVIAMVGLLSLPAAAQIIRPIKADIPFAFTVADTQLPPGAYTIRTVEDMDLNALVIESADRKTSVFFLAGEADLSRPAAKTELEFTKYGDREFLTQIFEQGTGSGAQVVEGHTELKLTKSKIKHTRHRNPAKTT